MDDLPTNVENLSPSFYITICVLCSVTFDWLWLPRTFILLAMTFQLTRQESPWATKASLAGSTKMSLEVLGWQGVFKCLRGFYWMRLLSARSTCVMRLMKFGGKMGPLPSCLSIFFLSIFLLLQKSFQLTCHLLHCYKADSLKMWIIYQ